jgi:hypothetical protein
MMVGSLVLGFAAQACTLGSDTYITEKADLSAAKDGGTSTATTTSASASAGGTCGTDDFAKVDLTKQTACGNGKGHCYDKTKVGGSSNLDPCPDASQVCVPDEFLTAGGNKLKSCTTIIPSAGACFTIDAISKIASMGGSALGQDVCDPGQKCVPCTDPTNGGAPTGFCDPVGVHTNACSGGGAAATTGAAAAPGCCNVGGTSKGTCMASKVVPEGQQDLIGADTCSGDNKCIPNSFIQGKPSTCNAGIMGNGVCMDKCFSNMMSIAGGIGILSKESCADTEVCIPCLFMSGQNVPGCQ